FAIEKFPELKELRRLFVGRVMHYSKEQWESDVNDILKFNVSTQDDDAKWAKTDITDIDEEESKPAALNEEGGVSGPEEQESEERKEENNVGDGNS
ncbi:MAG: hypothetical protein Q8L57_04135, partial [bacterium]|nr:hypothetical protein [bacterium]